MSWASREREDTWNRDAWDKLKSGQVTALIFWAKTQMGWRETSGLDVTGEGFNVVIAGRDKGVL